ncbi:uncharacterized protein LOC127557353 [Antechinus flavipes]|uniref:uncharacterized protein LOC127557353 n=1 Tax=Antechinus flavipes TaxID=38775 RepID=UPI00223660E9|nr:uncharacterized protein LOC127557353 [Antechinus flavipes]
MQRVVGRGHPRKPAARALPLPHGLAAPLTWSARRRRRREGSERREASKGQRSAARTSATKLGAKLRWRGTDTLRSGPGVRRGSGRDCHQLRFPLPLRSFMGEKGGGSPGKVEAGRGNCWFRFLPAKEGLSQQSPQGAAVLRWKRVLDCGREEAPPPPPPQTAPQYGRPAAPPGEKAGLSRAAPSPCRPAAARYGLCTAAAASAASSASASGAAPTPPPPRDGVLSLLRPHCPLPPLPPPLLGPVRKFYLLPRPLSLLPDITPFPVWGYVWNHSLGKGNRRETNQDVPKS